MTDREKLLELMGHCACIEGYGADLINDKVGYLIANGVTVKKYGRWVMTLYATTSKRGRVISNKKFACSECGYGNGRKQTNYCPNCGAKMDGDKHEV